MVSRDPNQNPPYDPNNPYDPYHSPPPPYPQQGEWAPPPTVYVPLERRRERRRSPFGLPRIPRRLQRGVGCLPFIFAFAIAGIVLLVYLLAPVRTNILVLGIDYTESGSALGRSDTLILSTIIPLDPYVGILSIPRDLWVVIPGVGENRINTAHFFAEGQRTGAGPQAAIETVRQNFGVDVDYYARIRFDGFRDVVNALGGVDIELSQPMAGYPAGKHHLTGNKALAFVRNRQGSDDFFRMEQGQFLIKEVLKQALHPSKWPRLPGVFLAASRSIDTNIPVWQWPRLGLALLRAGPSGIDNRIISREMVSPLITDQGANVLIPNWGSINPVLLEMFGQ